MSSRTSQTESIEFTLNQLDNPDERILAALVSRTVSLCSIEFHNLNNVKPHVVFSFKLEVGPQQGRPHDRFMGCRLSIESDPDSEDELKGNDGGPGIFTITALPYLGSSRGATASFDFNVITRTTIRNWIEIFMGTYQGLAAAQQSNLTLFDFVTTNAKKKDGCRDFICQCFLRAYNLGIVQGYSSSPIAPQDTQIIGDGHIRRHPELGDTSSVWFFEIIDKNFRKGKNGNKDTITVNPEPMHRGKFMDQRFARIESFPAGDPVRQYPLNYTTQPAAQNPAGNSGHGGAPGGAGGAGRGGGAGDSPQGGPGQPGVPPSNGSGSGSGSRQGRGGRTGGPTGGPPGNQLGRGAVGGRPTPTNPGMGLAPVKKLGAQTAAPLTSRPKIPSTVTKPSAKTAQTRPPSGQTATAAKGSPAVKDKQTRTAPAVKGTQTKTVPAVNDTQTKTASAGKNAQTKTALAMKDTQRKADPAVKGAQTKTTPAVKDTQAKTGSAVKGTPIKKTKD